MSTNLKRFTVSITPELEKEMNFLKRERYYATNRTTMIRDLLLKGIIEAKKQIEFEPDKNDVSSQIEDAESF